MGKFDIPNNDIFPITNLIEPEVWIEYLRLPRNNNGCVNVIAMRIPKGVKVRCTIVETGQYVWEYLM